MANVFYVRMNDPAQVSAHKFIEPNPEKFPPMQNGDLCFVRLEKEFKPVKLKRLWKFIAFVNNPDGSVTAEFEPYWKDASGNEIFFDTLEVIKKFIALNLFELNMNLLIFTHRPAPRSVIPLTVTNQTVFDQAIQSVSNFNNYISTDSNYRQINVTNHIAPNSQNIQLSKDASGVYTLNPAPFVGTDIQNLFDGTQPNKYTPSTRRDAKELMYRYLKNGTGDYTLIGFYDLFCTQVDPAVSAGSKKASKAAAEESLPSEGDKTAEEETAEVTFAGLGGETYEYWYNAPAITNGENRILYGTPGCGKSHTLATRLDAVIADEEFKPRVTFHQDYTYTDFVGQILPVLNATGGVEYTFDPGPFTRALALALQNPGQKVALVIEEINRGNAASIFGDLFQLLDRNANGVSEYKLTNWQITEYFKKTFAYDLPYIKIPGNLSLYATMNTGDQNVFTLDTAFKRRWKFEKLSNEFNGEAHKDQFVPGMDDVTWENFVKAINAHMIADGTFDSEDKQLGKFFVTGSQLLTAPGEAAAANKTSDFAYKVLEYLWNDVAKFDRERWFKIDKYKTLDSVIAAWKKGNGKDVFVSQIVFANTVLSIAAAPEEAGDSE